MKKKKMEQKDKFENKNNEENLKMKKLFESKEDLWKMYKRFFEIDKNGEALAMKKLE